nr:rhamnose-binding lectin-like [Halyomorpha halys]
MMGRIMMFLLAFGTLLLTVLTTSATEVAVKPKPSDPVSFLCHEGEFIIKTRRNHSEANRARPGEWKTACENEKLELDCGRGKTVRIIDVEYGRSDGFTCHRYPHFFLSCSSSEAYHKVHQRCDNKEKCTIVANTDEFGDPCPGIIKYLKVKHRCEPVVPGTLKKVVICENDRKTLTCPKGTYLMIADASYGRTDKTTCPHPNILNTNCSAKNVMDILGAKCDQKERCELSSVNKWFRDPCKGTHKYLTVEYQCIVDDLGYAAACENGNMEIVCKNSSVINVVRAEYGRGHPFVCNNSPRPMKPKGCSSPNEIAIIYGRCQGKSRCVIPATNEVFGDPCRGTSKYLELDYFCGEIWDPEDSPGAPTIKDVTKSTVTFTTEKLNKATSTKYKAQMKGSDEKEWTDVMDGSGIDFGAEHSVGGLDPNDELDIRVVMKKEDLSSCIPFTRFKTKS